MSKHKSHEKARWIMDTRKRIPPEHILKGHMLALPNWPIEAASLFTCQNVGL